MSSSFFFDAQNEQWGCAWLGLRGNFGLLKNEWMGIYLGIALLGKIYKIKL
jgi:hypothetical protein